MIRETNAVFINPLAYRVFPNIANPLNTGLTETVRLTGVLRIKDSNNNIRYYNRVSTIDLSEFTDYVDVELITAYGSTRLGRWLIQ